MKQITKHLIALTTAICLVAAGTAFAASVADNYGDHCSKCHGADGKGQTKMGKKLGVRDMTTAEYKKDFSDEKAYASIKDGIKKDGKEIKKSFASDLSDAQIKELVGYVKAMK